MSRIQKKCLVISSAVHALLILMLVFGAALMPSPEEPAGKILHMYDPAKVSDLASSGGEPDANVAPTPPAPVKAEAESAPAPAPKPHVEPPTPKPVVEIPKPPPRPEPRPIPHIEPPKHEEPPSHWYNMFSKSKPKEKETKDEPTPPTKHKVVIDKSDMAMHKASDHSADTGDNKAAKHRASKEISQTYAKLNKDLSTGTKVEINPGVGGGGEATANFRDVIMSKYSNAWSPPADLDDNVPVVVARITIARDGSVVSAHIITPSGNRSMDRSIENALETVTFIVPFPTGAKESERTVTVSFDLRLKRQNG